MASEVVMHAGFHRLSKDRDGEVTVCFKIPKSDADKALVIPEETALLLTVGLDRGKKKKRT